MGRLHSKIVILALASLASGAVALAAIEPPSQQRVTTEAKPRQIPAGRGQKPFDVTRHTIAVDEVQGGGPPRDGIPALDDPKFLPAELGGRRLAGDDRVLGFFFNGEAKAYPIRILNWHELVNDTVGGRAVLVTW